MVFDYSFIELGLTLILFSLFIKLALAPFHLWSLDVYEGPSSTFFCVEVVLHSSFQSERLLAILFFMGCVLSILWFVWF
jgi:formate hydrogenlyase subunit 3/multisubunit Na+/H+ antiporter MnhD subunit